LALLFFTSLLYSGGNRQRDLFILKGLSYAEKGPVLPGGDGRIKGGVGRDHDDDRVRVHLQKLFQRPQSTDARHRNVEQNNVVSTTSVGFKSLLTGLGQVDPVTFGREQRLQHFAHDLFVIDDQD
jgi:hypothetical protein